MGIVAVSPLRGTGVMFETFHIAGTIPEEREGLKMSATGSVSWRVKLYEGLLASQWTLKSFLDM